MWNTYKTTENFEAGTPWLLRFFDQIRFYPVSADELLEYREAFPHGRFRVRTEPATFCLSEYDKYLAAIQPTAAAFKSQQQAAFEAERARWIASGQHEFSSAVPDVALRSSEDQEIPHGCDPVRSPITASVWSVAVQPGERVEAGQRLLVLEAMKMEVAVAAPKTGIIEEIRCAPGGIVNAGQNLLVMRAEAGA
jgi:urea carboxylase